MPFNPAEHLTPARKGSPPDYLAVKWRLVWLRDEHPDATTEVQHIEISPDIAIFKATVTIPGHGSATDYGSETPRDFGDYIEKAATKSLGRALAQLGYGTQFVGAELDEGVRIVDSPTAPRAPHSLTPHQVPQDAPKRRPSAEPLTPHQQGAVDSAWDMAASDTYPAVLAMLRTVFPSATPGQLTAIDDERRKIAAKHFPDAAMNGEKP